jgi:hypothetical protein
MIRKCSHKHRDVFTSVHYKNAKYLANHFDFEEYTPKASNSRLRPFCRVDVHSAHEDDHVDSADEDGGCPYALAPLAVDLLRG